MQRLLVFEKDPGNNVDLLDLSFPASIVEVSPALEIAQQQNAMSQHEFCSLLAIECQKFMKDTCYIVQRISGCSPSL